MKKILSLVFIAMFTVMVAAGCGSTPSSAPASQPASASQTPGSSTPASVPASSSLADISEPDVPAGNGTAIRIAGLKGPTTMGMVKLMSDSDAGETAYDYQVEMYGTADAIVPLLVSGELDAAAIPANLASVLYNNTEGAIQVAAINTLGVLYVVETGDAIQSIEDLRGKTVYSTGAGTTPQFALNYILGQNGIDPETDLTIEYKSEATEIAALLNAGEDAIAVLPQPYVTAVQMQNENVRVALNLTEEWDAVSTGSRMVTGVLVVRKAFLGDAAGAEAFATFLQDYQASIEWVNANTADAAQLVAAYGIVEKAPVAEKALPACNIVYIAGGDMVTDLAGYLEVLFEQNPAAVGGALPGDDFYLTEPAAGGATGGGDSVVDASDATDSSLPAA